MQQPEAKFKKKLNDAFAVVHPDGWHAYMKAIAKNGVPDLHYQIRRGCAWVEAKVNGNALSSTQMLTLTKMVNAGAVVKVVTLLGTALPKEAQRILISRVVDGAIGRRPFVAPIIEVELPAIKTPDFWSLVFKP